MVILFVICFLYDAIGAYKTQKPINFPQFIVMVYTKDLACGVWAGHLWYLYSYIAFLIALPFLRALVHRLDDKYFYYMLFLAAMFNAVIPICEYRLFQGKFPLASSVKPNWIIGEQIVLYPCIGYFLERRIETEKLLKKGRELMILWAINVACIGVSCYMTLYKGRIDGVINESTSQTFFSSFVMVNCITVYLSAKYLCARVKIPPLAERAVLSLGKATFGIYLIHILVKGEIMNPVLDFLLGLGINDMLAALLTSAFIMLVCYLIVWVMLKIPVVKKLFGG